MKNFKITAINKSGEIVIERETKEAWSISELQSFLDEVKIPLYAGGVVYVLIEAIDTVEKKGYKEYPIVDFYA